MSEKISADILESARRCYDALGRGSASDSERIAIAIMAERERAAKIAEDWLSYISQGEHFQTGIERIAARIRGEG